jgi:glycosyltransferase involved in cell wall biosynthesis
MMPTLCVIIPCRNEERYIAQCLDSVLNTSYPKELLEILIIDGQSLDKTRQIVQKYTFSYPFIRLIDNPDKIAPTALNIGILESKSSYIIRLDAHASYPKDYFQQLISHSIRLEAANVGGVWKTQILHHTRIANAIKNVLSDPYGVGNALFRTGISTITEVDTVPFGCYRRDIFDKYGLFDERLIRNQDIEFNKRIIRGGGKIYLLPDVTCTYYARETYSDLARNNYQNGYWNILTPYYTRTLNSLSLRHFIPLLFVLVLIIPTLLSPFYYPLLCIGIIIAVIYLTIIGGRAWKIKNNTTWFHQLWAFITLHFSYGFGSIGGIISLTKKILLKDL